MSEESAHGRFVWYDLMTTDPEAAKAFYTAVVGWGTTVWEGPEPYTMWTAGSASETPEAPIGGTMQLPPEAVTQGALPHWLAYVSVPDVEAAVRKAQELGATVMVPATDIPSVGQYAVLTDPQGAQLAVYKSANAASAAAPAGPPSVGEFSWHELATTDYEAAFAFYAELFGWEKTSAMDMGPAGVYQMYGQGGIPYGGIYNTMPENPGSPAWLHYARVPDVHRAAETIRAHGGQVINGPMEVPGGDWIVMGIDPQGGPFAVHQVGGAQT